MRLVDSKKDRKMNPVNGLDEFHSAPANASRPRDARTHPAAWNRTRFGARGSNDSIRPIPDRSFRFYQVPI
ncbi:hypothetical protein [Burkholderia ubonensis]|uniref:hypothetical protein n=1 Tax=Burkholderia ubonensis TaxID=101571 RepID=UPI001055D9FD|nr:hypothetical protein [Burkholderia ubonensis]